MQNERNFRISRRAPQQILSAWCVLALSTWLVATAQSPTPSAIAGDWSGTLNMGASTLPVILHLRDAPGGGWTATLDSPSQKATGIAGVNAKLDGTKFTFEAPSIKGAFAGTLSADGKTLDGTWTQTKSWPLVLKQTNTAAQSATPALSQPATEPAADNVVFFVDPAGNQLPLEYNVPFRLGFSSFQVTKREQAIVRFPQGTPLRFIARVPAGKTADFMQLDRAEGWREIPIDWAGKNKGMVNPKEAKQARLVPFTSTPVGSAQLMTPDQPLVPGEYCLNLHSEEWFCFGVDDASAATQAAPAATGAGMSNADVLKMASAGLGADVIVGAIRQASSHNFDLFHR
jgi:hypothetical protein